MLCIFEDEALEYRYWVTAIILSGSSDRPNGKGDEEDLRFLKMSESERLGEDGGNGESLC